MKKKYYYFNTEILKNVSLHFFLLIILRNLWIINHIYIYLIKKLLCNVILNYEIEKEKIIRQDYVTKTLIEYSKNIKK